MEEYSEMIWKQWKKGKSNLPSHFTIFFCIFQIFSQFNPPFFRIFHNFSLFNLLFFRIFHIFSLFNLGFFHIFHIFSLFNLLFLLYFPYFFTIQLAFLHFLLPHLHSYGKCERKVGWIVKRFGKYRRILWNEMEEK
jgi:hypothetical protein